MLVYHPRWPDDSLTKIRTLGSKLCTYQYDRSTAHRAPQHRAVLWMTRSYQKSTKKQKRRQELCHCCIFWLRLPTLVWKGEDWSKCTVVSWRLRTVFILNVWSTSSLDRCHRNVSSITTNTLKFCSLIYLYIWLNLLLNEKIIGNVLICRFANIIFKGARSRRCHTADEHVVINITCIIIIIILAVHATAGRWPPQLAPCTSILGRSHPLTANGFLDVISPSSFWVFLLVVFHLWVSHSDVIFAHLVFFILATCPAHCPFMHFTFSIISITPVFDLIISFLILSLLVMFNNDLSMLRWATASFLSRCFVKVHVSAP